MGEEGQLPHRLRGGAEEVGRELDAVARTRRGWGSQEGQEDGALGRRVLGREGRARGQERLLRGVRERARRAGNLSSGESNGLNLAEWLHEKES